MANAIAGTAYLTIDGANYALRGSFEYSPLLAEKEGIAGIDSVHGYTVKPRVPSMKAKFSDLGGVSVTALGAVVGVTIIAELVNGKVVTLTDAWVKGAINVNAEDGSYEVEFEGMDIDEEVAA
jgi:hypothetical protein